MAKNIVAAMSECSVKRLVFIGAVGIYNEIPVWENAKSEQEGRAAAPGLKLFA